MAVVAAEIRTRVPLYLVLSTLVASSLLPSSGCHRKSVPQPPDLSGCTRLEVQDPCATLNYVFADTPMHPHLFTDAEKELLQSSRTYAITEPEGVRNFVRVIRQGVFLRRATTPPNPRAITVTCYRGDERMLSLVTQAVYVRAPDWNIFQYPSNVFNLSGLRSPGAEPLRLRLDCALQQSRLTTESLLFRRSIVTYPDPNRWCDATARALWRLHGGQGTMEGDAITVALFRCPNMRQNGSRPSNASVSSWVSHYAMNPNCRPSSPGDTVLLFETQAGWNQHGGPELFTFDNHDPKGGCALLNDGTVKFVRTKEELAQLRWKP